MTLSLPSPASSCVLFDIDFRLVDGTEMADVERTQKMIPFVTWLVVGVNVFDLDLGVHIDSVKQPIQCDSVGS